MIHDFDARCTVHHNVTKCLRSVSHDGPCVQDPNNLSVRVIPPFSTYPEDHAKLLNLARKCELSDDANAIELGDMVRAILEDEAVAARLAE